MRRICLQWAFPILTILALAWSPASARAGFIATETTSVTQQASGLWSYSYTVAVGATSSATVSEFDLLVYAPVDPNSIVTPSNFYTFYNPGDSVINFTAFDSGIAIGSTGTFSFLSAFAPGSAGYQVQGLITSNTGPNSTADITGFTSAPVPEPSSLLMCGLGTAGVLGLISRSRRRSNS